MTEPPAAGLIAGTLADLRTLMSAPPTLRRGYVQIAKPPNPAAGAGFTYKIDPAWYERIVALAFSFAASAAAGLRSILLNYNDPDGALVNQTPLTPQINPSETWLVSADFQTTVAQGAAPSQSATGSVTSPLANGVICSVALPAGVYTITWLIGYGGTTGAPEADNVGVFVGAALVAQSVSGTSSGTNYPQDPLQIVVPAGGATVSLQAINAGTAASVYRGTFTATDASALASYPVMPDLILKPSWQAVISVTGVQAADQLSSIVFYTERYPSNWADGSLGSDLEGELAALGGP